MLPEPLDPPLTDENLEAYFAYEDENDALETGEPQGEGRQPFPSPVVAWSVCDTGSAEWAMRKLAHAEHQIAEVRADARRFKDQIEAWEKAQLRRPERAANFFTGQLVTYARRKREEEDQKTLKLPSGEVTSRRNPARPEIVKDEESDFIEWAKATAPKAVKAKWSPVMAEVKKVVTFETVLVPDYLSENLTLVRWPSADGEATWVAVPPSMAEAMPAGITDVSSEVAAEDLPNFHPEVWPISDGQRVPGVVQVPEEVTYTVKPDLT